MHELLWHQSTAQSVGLLWFASVRGFVSTAILPLDPVLTEKCWNCNWNGILTNPIDVEYKRFLAEGHRHLIPGLGAAL